MEKQRLLILSIVTILAFSYKPNRASAFDMTQQDRTQVLYSNQFNFDEDGQPTVSVRISEGQEQIQLRSQVGFRFMPSGSQGSQTTVTGGGQWTFKIANGKPAQIRRWLSLAVLKATEFREIRELHQKIKEQGHSLKVSQFESGSVIGVRGTTLDTRRIRLALGPFSTDAQLQSTKRLIQERWTYPLETYIELLAPARGTIVATNQKGVTFKVPDVLWLEGLKGKPIVCDRLVWGQGTPKSGTERRSYDGKLYLTVGQDGKLAVVNLLSAERLLKGVVPSELYTSAPLEALKAQAVAARGQLLAKIGTRHLADPYHLCAETHCQVYTGRGRMHRRTNTAVEQTSGQLLFDHEGLVDTTYSSTCGGHSETFENVWGGAAKSAHPGFFDRKEQKYPSSINANELRHFIDTPPPAYCKASGSRAKTFRWTKTVSTKRVTRGVAKHKDIGTVYGLKVIKRGQSGRVLDIEYFGTNGRIIIEGEYTNRKVLGNLKSGLWYRLTKDGTKDKPPTKWVFKGAGFGHGVGLCQHGAMGMAKSGIGWKEILLHYYKGSKLLSLW